VQQESSERLPGQYHPRGEEMSTQSLLIGVLAAMAGVIVFLAVILLQPPVVEERLTFNQLLDLVNNKASALSEVNITYDVNITLISGSVAGEMNYFKNKTSKTVTLSPSLMAYQGYAIMLPPDEMVGFINDSDRHEYAGELDNNGTACWSAITEPLGSQYNSLINGDYLFVTCFDQVTGYPSLAYSSELAGDEVVYSKIFIKTIAYR